MSTMNRRRRAVPKPAHVIDARPRLAVADGEPLPPPNKGRLYYDFEIPKAFLGGLPKIKDKTRWVRENFPRDVRVKIGRDSAWWESDIRRHLATLGKS